MAFSPTPLNTRAIAPPENASGICNKKQPRHKQPIELQREDAKHQGQRNDRRDTHVNRCAFKLGIQAAELHFVPCRQRKRCKRLPGSRYHLPEGGSRSRKYALKTGLQ